MKFLVIISLFLIACNDQIPGAHSEKDTINSGDEKESILGKDTIFNIGDFLLKAKSNIKFKIVGKEVKPNSDHIYDDIIYEDNEVKILGNISLMYGGVYKKIKKKLRFDDFKTDEIYNGKLAVPDFSTDKKAKEYEKDIIENCKLTGVNFAGRYTAFDITANGTECSFLVIVDRINGKIFYSSVPFDEGDGHYGIEFRSGSTLLIVNSSLIDEKFTDYYLVSDYSGITKWADGSLHKIYPCGNVKTLMYYKFTGKEFIKQQ